MGLSGTPPSDSSTGSFLSSLSVSTLAEDANITKKCDQKVSHTSSPVVAPTLTQRA